MVTKANKRKVAEFWHNQCAYCHKTDYLQFHHIKPKSAGGTDEPDNLLLSLAACFAVLKGFPNSFFNFFFSVLLPLITIAYR